MKKALIVSGLLFGALLTAQAEDTITLKKAKPKVGDKFQFETTSATKIDVEYRDEKDQKLQAVSQQREQSFKYDVEVKNLDSNGRPEIIEVTVHKHSASMEQTGRPKMERKLDLDGVVVVLKRKEDEVEATRKDGKPLNAQQKQALLGDFSEFVAKESKSPTDSIPEKPIKVGEVFETPSSEGLKYLSKASAKQFNSVGFKFTYKENRTINDIPCAVFDVEIEMDLKSGGPKIKTVQKGEVALSIDGKIKIFEKLTGPMTMNGTTKNRMGATIKIVGKGTNSSTASAKKLS